MEKVISITILIALIIGAISTLIVIIDYHKQWKLIEKKLKDKEEISNMSDKEKLNNIINFVTHITIYSGYGYDYKQAIKMLYSGYDLNKVKEWYYIQVKGSNYEKN